MAKDTPKSTPDRRPADDGTASPKKSPFNFNFSEMMSKLPPESKGSKEPSGSNAAGPPRKATITNESIAKNKQYIFGATPVKPEARSFSLSFNTGSVSESFALSTGRKTKPLPTKGLQMTPGAAPPTVNAEEPKADSPETASPQRESNTRRSQSPDSESESAASNAASELSDSNASDSELMLLGHKVENGLSHERRTAPLVTRDAYRLAEAGLGRAIPQYGVLGSIISINDQSGAEPFVDPRLYLNTNAPFSAVVCGVQGSGKSHTVGVMLESMLIPGDPRIGVLERPLSALVLHFGENAAGGQPCEAAFQCKTMDANVSPPAVRVYVSPTRLKTMKKVYRKNFGRRVEVLPLKIAHDELDASNILSMMSVSTSHEPPLYIQIILSLLREMGETFTYPNFKDRLQALAKDFNPQQKSAFQQRFALLESFLQAERMEDVRFKEGQITIIDLSDPFIDPASACSLFEIMTRIYVRSDVGAGKVLVVDEAHKYLTKDRGAQVLTDSLLSIVRQQRHLGMRLIISTQEPTVIPETLLELCAIKILHRFDSWSWFAHVSKHVSSEFDEKAFDSVVNLETGEAIVLAASGVGVFTKAGASEKPIKRVGAFGRRYLVIKTRQRITSDGGASILAV